MHLLQLLAAHLLQLLAAHLKLLISHRNMVASRSHLLLQHALNKFLRNQYLLQLQDMVAKLLPRLPVRCKALTYPVSSSIDPVTLVSRHLSRPSLSNNALNLLLYQQQLLKLQHQSLKLVSSKQMPFQDSVRLVLRNKNLIQFQDKNLIQFQDSLGLVLTSKRLCLFQD